MAGGTKLLNDDDAGLLRVALAKALLDRPTAERLARQADADHPVAALLLSEGLMTSHTIDMLRKELGRGDGRSIAGFRLLGRLGKGGMGSVYKARQLSMDREVALKVLDPALARDQDFVERFLREARAMGAIAHPHVVSCYDAGQDGRHLYIALELMTGGDVAGLLADNGGRLPLRRALEIVRDAAEGLEALHQAGLIHRDLKPANLFLTIDGRAKVADLGLARAELGDERMTQTGTVMGTPAFMSVEQARGEQDLDIRSDIHALGATLYMLLTGAQPFTGNSPFAVVAQVINQPFPDPRRVLPTVPAAVAELVLRCTERERSRRLATPRELARACSALLADPQLQLPEPQPPTPQTTLRAAGRKASWRGPGWRRKMLIAGGMLLVLLVITHRKPPAAPPIPGWSGGSGAWQAIDYGLVVHGDWRLRWQAILSDGQGLHVTMQTTTESTAWLALPDWGVTLGDADGSGQVRLGVTAGSLATISFANPWTPDPGIEQKLCVSSVGNRLLAFANGRMIGSAIRADGGQTTAVEVVGAGKSDSRFQDLGTWVTNASAFASDAATAERLAERAVDAKWLEEPGTRVVTVQADQVLDTHIQVAAGQVIFVEPYPLDTWTCAEKGTALQTALHVDANGTPALDNALDRRFPTGCLLVNLSSARFRAGRITAIAAGNLLLRINAAPGSLITGSISVRIRGPAAP